MAHIRMRTSAKYRLTPHLISKEVKLALKLVDALDVRHVSPLECCKFWVKVSELNHPKLSQVGNARVRRVLIHDYRHVGHVLRAEPFRHCHFLFTQWEIDRKVVKRNLRKSKRWKP